MSTETKWPFELGVVLMHTKSLAYGEACQRKEMADGTVQYRLTHELMGRKYITAWIDANDLKIAEP